MWTFLIFVSFFLHFSPGIWNVRAVPNCVNLSNFQIIYYGLYTVKLNCIVFTSQAQNKTKQQQHTLHDDLQSHCMHVEVDFRNDCGSARCLDQKLWTRRERTFCTQCTSPAHLGAFGTIQQQEHRDTRPRAGQNSLFVSPCSSPLKLLPHIPGAPNCRHPARPLTPWVNLCYQTGRPAGRAHYCSLPARQ